VKVGDSPTTRVGEVLCVLTGSIMRLPSLSGGHSIEYGLVNTFSIDNWASLFDRFIGDSKAPSINGEVDFQLGRTNEDR
jgi:hypothetical protein